MYRDGASFRDPAGCVFWLNGRVFRTLSRDGLATYASASERPVVKRLRAERRLVDARLIPEEEWPSEAVEIAPAALLEHPVVPFLSYPYEWPFEALRTAALAHLDLHRELLEEGLSLVDATAYNIQFINTRPLFIDALSIRPYRDGEYWLGHDQFLRQFFNPLLLEAVCGVPFNASYRGDLEGIASRDMARLLPFRARLRPTIIADVILPARLAERSVAKPQQCPNDRRARRPLPKQAYLSLLAHLKRAITGLTVTRTRTVWSQYSAENSYSDVGRSIKEAFVREFSARARLRCLLDIGCNDGAYSKVALSSGTASVIGLDTDRAALDRAFLTAQSANLAFLPLSADLANPSPGQGWRGLERSALTSRLNVDGLLALAVLHHLAIGRNVPLKDLVDFLVDLAPQGIIEFVPKEDPMIALMLAGRQDVFPDYGEPAFRAHLESRARIVREAAMPASGRVLFHFERAGE